MPTKQQRPIWPWFVGVTALTLLAFAPALSANFVSWDDPQNFLANPYYRGLGFTNLKWAWTTTLMGHYVPLTWMSLGLDYVLWGMDARGYHLTNVLIHCANAALVFMVAVRLLPAGHAAPRLVAAVASLLFAVHPLRVESVAWVTERRDVLSLFFLLIATLAYLRQAREAQVGRWYAATIMAFAAALLSKASVFTFPAVLVLLNWYPLDRYRSGFRRVATELLPLFAMSAITAVGSLFALGAAEEAQLRLPQKLAVSAYSIWFYLLKSVWPSGLAPLYEMPRGVDPTAPRFLIAYAATALLIASLVALRTRARGAVVAVLAFLVLVFPFLGAVQNGPQIAADRYTYLAGIPLALLAASLLLRLDRSKAVPVATAGVLALMVGTWLQSSRWVNSERLWARVLEVDSTSAVAHNSYGNVLAEAGNVNGAILHYQRAIALNPNYHDPYNNLGIWLSQVGRLDEAIAAYRVALRLKPDYPDAQSNLANVLAMKGDFDEAIKHYERAVQLAPNLVDPRFNWALALAKSGRLLEAKARVAELIALYPQNAEAHALYADLDAAVRQVAVRAPRKKRKNG